MKLTFISSIGLKRIKDRKSANYSLNRTDSNDHIKKFNHLSNCWKKTWLEDKLCSRDLAPPLFTTEHFVLDLPFAQKTSIATHPFYRSLRYPLPLPPCTLNLRRTRSSLPQRPSRARELQAFSDYPKVTQIFRMERWSNSEKKWSWPFFRTTLSCWVIR